MSGRHLEAYPQCHRIDPFERMHTMHAHPHRRPLRLRVLVAALLSVGSVVVFAVPAGPTALASPASVGTIHTRPIGTWGPRMASDVTGELWLTNSVSRSLVRVRADGTTTFFATPSGRRPYDITAGPDGAMWFTEQDAVGRITLDGTITEITSPGIEHPLWIATGASGVWFTDGPSIRHRDVDGSIQVYNDPSMTPGVDGIGIAPDGRVWFSNGTNNLIGVLATDGTVVTFHDAAITEPRLVRPSVTGDVWFVNAVGDEIGRVRTDGTVESFTAPQVISSAADIMVDPGGNLWFTGNVVGFITPGGVVDAPLPDGTNGAEFIAMGPSGELWLNDFPGDIYRRTVAGAVSGPYGDLITYPQAIAAGSDGSVWVGGPWSGIGRIAPNGTFTVFHGSGLANVNAIAVDAHANAWFATWDGVGRVNPTGQFTPYTDPGIGRVSGIAISPDGDVWFFSDPGRIGRVTPAGAMQFFDAPRSCYSNMTAGPDIVAGSDGAMWFVDCGAIARITPAGDTEVVADVNNVTSLAAGPDGNIWFAAWFTIGRITPSGDITTFPPYSPIPDINFQPIALATGSDGALWFTNGDDRIGRITTSGSVTYFADDAIKNPNGEGPYSITAAGNEMVFTIPGNSSIGSISTGGPAPTTHPDTTMQPASDAPPGDLPAADPSAITRPASPVAATPSFTG